MAYEDYMEELGDYIADLEQAEYERQNETVEEWSERVMRSKAGRYLVVTRSPKNNDFLYYRRKDPGSRSYWTKYPATALFYETERQANAVVKTLQFNQPHVRRVNAIGQITKLS